MLATVEMIEATVSENGITATILNTRRHDTQHQRWSSKKGSAEKEDGTFWVLGQLVLLWHT